MHVRTTGAGVGLQDLDFFRAPGANFEVGDGGKSKYRV
jgi:hypothetical protein